MSWVQFYRHYSARNRNWSSNYLARIEDIRGVQRFLELAHQFELGFRAIFRQPGAFGLPDAMFGAETAAQLMHEIVDAATDALTLRRPLLGGQISGQDHVVVQVAVPNMAECHQLQVGT